MRRRSSRGWILPAVLCLLTVAGILFFGLHSLSEQQNAAAHRLSFQRTADYLAEAGLEVLQTRIRENLAPGPVQWTRPLADQGLFPLLLLPVQELVRQAGVVAGRDFDELAVRCFGPEWRYTLDTLERDHPGAAIELSLELQPEALYPPDTGLKDPVEKRIRLVLASRATYRRTSSVARMVDELKVVNPLAPLTCKFTLFASEAEAGDAYNVYQNHENGTPFMGQPQAPTFCYNTPGSAVDDLTLTNDNLANVEAGRPFDTMEKVRAALEGRGWIFLGTASGDLDLNLTAGASLDDNQHPTLDFEAGEFHHIYNPLTRNSEPGFFFLLNAPDFFAPDRTYPSAAGVEQKPYVNFLYWGFHRPTPGGNALRADGALGTSLRTEDSSTLHLFGTDNEPSRTLVFGPVYQDIVRFAYLAIDRDATDADESLQLANYRASGAPDGYSISLRDTIDPIFKFVESEAAFQEELAREASGRAFARLEPALSVLTNDNYFADLNGDHLREPDEPVIDPEHPTVPADPATYTYGRMFAGMFEGAAENQGYKRFMSQVERVPYVKMIDYMVYSKMVPPERHPAYRGLVAGGDQADYLEPRDVKVPFHDPLHDTMGAPLYYQGDLRDFFHGGARPSPAEQVLRARSCLTVADQAELLALFPLVQPGGGAPPVLTLRGTVLVRQGGLALPRCLYQGSGAIVLADPAGANVVSEGLEPLGPAVLTLATLTGDVVLKGGVPHRALFMAPAGRLVHEDLQPLDVGFGLGVRKLPPQALTAGGSLRYNGLTDPCTWDPVRGGYLEYYQVHLSDVFLEWSVRGGGA